MQLGESDTNKKERVHQVTMSGLQSKGTKILCIQKLDDQQTVIQDLNKLD